MGKKTPLILNIYSVFTDLLIYVTEMQPHFFKNIVLTGGNTLFPGFRDRVYSEVRCLTPTDYDVSVVLPEK